MKTATTYRSRLNAKINGAARVRFYSRDLQDADTLAMIRAKAAAYAANNPAPRAVYLLG